MRDASVLDVARVAALHVETFRETHGGGPTLSIRETQWRRILGANDATDFTLVVAEPAQQLGVGKVWRAHHTGLKRTVLLNWQDAFRRHNNLSALFQLGLIIMADREPKIPAGLCSKCCHAEQVPSARGSTFVLCRMSTIDPRFPKYPRLPVNECTGYSPKA